MAISINDFRLSVVKDLLKFEDTCDVVRLRFAKIGCKARENRKYWKDCYR